MKKNAKGRTTLRELAKALGLSPTTVSRALNGFPEVSEETRKRVVEVARDMKYVPDRNAHRLAHGIVGAFGIVFPSAAETLIDPLFAEFIGGISKFTAKKDLEIILQGALPDNELETYERAAAQRSVDGFIISGPLLRDPRIENLNNLDFPFILHGRTECDTSFAWMDIDNYGAFKKATKLLIDYGHKRIALIGETSKMRFAKDRLDGFKDAMADASIPVLRPLVFEDRMTEQVGYKYAKQCFSKPLKQRPTAFLCSSIFIALGVLRAGREYKLNVPKDFSIITHDDRVHYVRAEYLDPPLTATQSSLRLAGCRVAEMLHARVSGTPAHELQEEWSVELVLRNSVGHITS